MSETGFLAQQQRRSPTGFTLIVAAHAAALGALALMQTPIFVDRDTGPIKITPIPVDPDPPPVEPPRPRTEQPSRRTTAPTPLPIPDTGPVINDPPGPPISYDPGPIGELYADLGPPPIPAAPVRRAAELLSRDLQPPYPASEIRAQRGGRVQVRVTIGTDGRVTAVEMLSATSDAFWRATERQALTRWRFRPATEDGRPVVATKVLTVTFRIEDAV